MRVLFYLKTPLRNETGFVFWKLTYDALFFSARQADNFFLFFCTLEFV